VPLELIIEKESIMGTVAVAAIAGVIASIVMDGISFVTFSLILGDKVDALKAKMKSMKNQQSLPLENLPVL
jgi:hypothetical protein